MPSDIKLIAVDLDGTLLNHDKQIPLRNAAAVRAAAESGVHVCLASGRMIAGIRPFAQELGLRSPLVSCNGAYVVDEDGDEIHHFALPDSVRNDLLDYVEETGVHLNVYVRDTMFFSDDTHWGELYLSRVKNVNPAVKDLGFFRTVQPTKMLFVHTPDKIVEHQKELTRRLPSDKVTITISEPDYIEFLPPSVNKGIGVRAVAKHLGLAREQVAAIGDYLNDLEMVEWAGFGGAVANAQEQVRLAADVVVSSNDDAGVSEFIETALSLAIGL